MTGCLTSVPFWALIVSVISLVISGLACWNAWQARRTSVIPVLVFTRRSSTEWQIENVGNGPALNVLSREKDFGGKWKEEIIPLYPIAAKTTINLPWFKSAETLVATYADIHGRSYTATCEKDLSGWEHRNLYPSWKGNQSEWKARQAQMPPNLTSD